MFDITAAKHGGDPESIAAFGEGKERTKERVYQAIVDAGEVGLTCDELAVIWGVSPNGISGRFTDLKKEGAIVARGKRPTRTGNRAKVYVANVSVPAIAV